MDDSDKTQVFILVKVLQYIQFCVGIWGLLTRPWSRYNTGILNREPRQGWNTEVFLFDFHIPAALHCSLPTAFSPLCHAVGTSRSSPGLRLSLVRCIIQICSLTQAIHRNTTAIIKKTTAPTVGWHFVLLRMRWGCSSTAWAFICSTTLPTLQPGCVLEQWVPGFMDWFPARLQTGQRSPSPRYSYLESLSPGGSGGWANACGGCRAQPSSLFSSMSPFCCALPPPHLPHKHQLKKGKNEKVSTLELAPQTMCVLCE